MYVRTGLFNESRRDDWGEKGEELRGAKKSQKGKAKKGEDKEGLMSFSGIRHPFPRISAHGYIYW